MNLTDLFERRYLPHIIRHRKPRTVAEYTRLARTLLLPALGEHDIATLTFSEIEAWHEGQAARIQANRALALTSAMLGYAVKRSLLPVNPCRGVTRNRETPREHFYLPGEAQAIVAAALAFPDVRGRYIALNLLTGARPSELLNSGPHWRHGSVLRTPDSKTGARTIYLPPAACAILDGLVVSARFTIGKSVAEGCYFPAGMDLRRAWGRILRAAGIPAARMYDLRHTFASSALAAGVNLSVIGLMLGHRKAQTTLRYSHLAPDTGLAGAAAAAERMGVA